ncbi:hypothetical protein [Cellulosimicrobium cellulans]|uniref:hypothetical protein n=1 Tax=Cellulosimicrobium cellulans TaxID=1710 RepID=UPI0005BBC1D3|nr:hypothetical protein [Cellulosimicrobium cellulans]
MSAKRRATYGYAEVAERIEQELGVRPALSTLRAATAKAEESTKSSPRVTAGMPAPLPSSARTVPAQFDRAAIERWLRRHPRKLERRAVEEAAAALSRGDAEADVVAKARADGLSWRAITEILNNHDGRARSTSAVHKRYQS